MGVKSKQRVFETVDGLKDRPVIRGHQAMEYLRDGRAKERIANIIPSANVRILENKNNIIVNKRMKDRIGVSTEPQRNQDEDIIDLSFTNDKSPGSVDAGAWRFIIFIG